MSKEYRKGPHTIYDIQYHFVWVTKYRYHILKGDVALRVRDLIRQICEARNITILNGHVSHGHVHLHVSCPPEISPSKIVQYVKGRSSRLIQQEFPISAKDIGEGIFGLAVTFVQQLEMLRRRRLLRILRVKKKQALKRPSPFLGSNNFAMFDFQSVKKSTGFQPVVV